MNQVEFLRAVNKYFLSFVLIILYPFRFLFFDKTKKDNKKVLVIRLWALGDVISVLPILKKLDSKGYEVDVLTTSNVGFLFGGYSFVNKVHLFNFKNPFSLFGLFFRLKREGYSVVIDTEQFLNVSTILGLFAMPKMFIGFSHLFRSKFYTDKVRYVEMRHFVDNFATLLKPLGIDAVKSLVPLSFKKSSKVKVDKILEEYKGKRFVGVHMGSGGTASGRRWSAGKFAELSNRISDKFDDVVIVFTGLDEEKIIYNGIKDKLMLKNELNLINKLSLSDFIYLCTRLDLFISNDTGPMHICAAMGIKVVGLFGMNNPCKVGAWPLSDNVNIYKNPKSNPIINNKYSVYPSDKFSTIDLISVDDVFAEVVKVLEK